MDDKILEQVYQENLEERLIAYISEQKNITLEKAMDIYYTSKMADDIYMGKNDIQYLDYKVLYDLMVKYEPEIF